MKLIGELRADSHADMIHSEQVEEIKKLLSHIENGTTDTADTIAVNSTSAYVDKDIADLEWEHLFLKHPQIIGMSCELPDNGSFFRCSELGVEIVATRDDNGVFRAFVNSCRHRGALVVKKQRGSTNSFLCRFHGWTYSREGSLLSVYKEDLFGSVNKECNGLIELPSKEDHGLLWVSLDRASDIDLDAALTEEFRSELDSWKFADLEYFDEDTYNVDCNWKHAVDAFGESYHFKFLHSKTLDLIFIGNAATCKTYGNNFRDLIARVEITDVVKQPEDTWNISKSAFIVYWLFPNTLIFPFDEGCYMLRIYPDKEDPRKHVSKATFYFKEGYSTNADIERNAVARTVSDMFIEIVEKEDYSMSVQQQLNANSGRMQTVMYGKNEPNLHHIHNSIRESIGMPKLEKYGQ